MRVEQKYAVILLQATGEPLTLKESVKFEECKALYDKTLADLEKARKTKGAMFKLENPWIFSCDPQFILRVTLVPVKIPKPAEAGNPYQQRMESQGFAETMKNPLGGPLTDEGYTKD
jgi:hypothetical protein